MMCLKRIGRLRVQNMLAILDSMVDVIEGNLYDHSDSTWIFALGKHELQKLQGKVASRDLDLLTTLYSLRVVYPTISGLH